MSSNEASFRAFFRRIAVCGFPGRVARGTWSEGCQRTTRALQRKGRGGSTVVCSVSLDLFCVASWRGLGKGDGGGVIFGWREGVARGLYGSLKYRKYEPTAIYSDTEEE